MSLFLGDCMKFLVFLFFFNGGPRILLARNILDPVIESSSADQVPGGWRSFMMEFVGAQKGSQVAGISRLKKYFQRFGYLNSANPMEILTDLYDEELESAVLAYQRNMGLSVTGVLDIDTVTEIMSPRCDISDQIKPTSSYNNDLHATIHYAYFQNKPRWIRQSPMTLTYAFSPEHLIDYLSLPEIKSTIARSFARWSAVIPVNFTETDNYLSADIRIGFYRGDHGDGNPFDGAKGVTLGHGFSPENGGFHLNGDKKWAVDLEKEKSKEAVDLESVATHEIGHILGLGHSTVKEAIMFPTLALRTKKVDLTNDDVEGVQELYGSNPNFNSGSLYASGTSSSWSGLIMERRRSWSAGWWTMTLTSICFIYLFI